MLGPRYPALIPPTDTIPGSLNGPEKLWPTNITPANTGQVE